MSESPIQQSGDRKPMSRLLRTVEPEPRHIIAGRPSAPPIAIALAKAPADRRRSGISCSDPILARRVNDFLFASSAS